MDIGMRSAVLANPPYRYRFCSNSRLGTAHRAKERVPDDSSQYGEEAPGTGRRQFPALQQSAAEEVHDEHFEKRTAAEMYHLFEELQRRQGTGGLPMALEEIGFQQLPTTDNDFGPGAGKKRRPSAVSPRSEEEVSAPNQFQMMSTAEVVALWERMQQRKGGNEASDP